MGSREREKKRERERVHVSRMGRSAGFKGRERDEKSGTEVDLVWGR